MKNKKIIWLSVFRNVVPADYENWLERLALQGWNIDHINQWNSIAMTFYRSEPRKYRYMKVWKREISRLSMQLGTYLGLCKTNQGTLF